MGESANYCSTCYNALGKGGVPHDSQVQAAEAAGKTPMTKKGTCSKCGKATVVVYYDA